MYQPGYQPGAPGYQPGAPGYQPGAPGYPTGAPGYQPGAPGYQPGAPGYQPAPAYPAPSFHIEGGNPMAVEYPKDQVIAAWNSSDPKSHLVGGFGYNAGRVRVPSPGRYYVYCQLYFNSKPGVHKNRVYLCTNNKVLLMIHNDMPGGLEQTAYAGGVFYLQPGEEIFVKPGPYSAKLWMAPNHCYFGAYQISPQ